MKFTTQPSEKALRALVKQHPRSNKFDVVKRKHNFLPQTINVIEELPLEEGKEHLKNDSGDFLSDTFCKDTKAFNTKKKINYLVPFFRDAQPLFSHMR